MLGNPKQIKLIPVSNHLSHSNHHFNCEMHNKPMINKFILQVIITKGELWQERWDTFIQRALVALFGCPRGDAMNIIH